MRASNYTICKSFDHSVDTGSRQYETFETNRGAHYIRRVYDHGFNVTVNSSCIGESPARIDQCDFNVTSILLMDEILQWVYYVFPGMVEKLIPYDELCNPCENEAIKNYCEELCQTTTGPPFGPFILK